MQLVAVLTNVYNGSVQHATQPHGCHRTRDIHTRDIHAQGGRTRGWRPLTAGAERRNGNEKEERNEERENPRPHGLGVAHGCVRGWRAGGRNTPEPPTRQPTDRGRTRERANPQEKGEPPQKRRNPNETRKIKIVIMRHVGIPWGDWMMKGERVTRSYRMRSIPRYVLLEPRTHR